MRLAMKKMRLAMKKMRLMRPQSKGSGHKKVSKIEFLPGKIVKIESFYEVKNRAAGENTVFPLLETALD